MAHITRLGLLRHLRAEPTEFVLHFSGGELAHSGRGLAFWYLPLSASAAVVPCDDRDLPFLFHARSRDFQDVTVQGVITFRVANPQTLASRVDFSIDLVSGAYRETPLEWLSEMLTQLAQQFATDYAANTDIREALSEGVEQTRVRISHGLETNERLQAMGLEIVSVRVSAVDPTSDLERALQTPTREAIQQASDEAVFQRRALAVEKERAISENELQSRIELARREELLIEQDGQNARRQATEEAEAGRIEATFEAERERLRAEAESDSIRMVQEARVEAEGAQIEIYRDLPPPVLLGLAAREFAGKLRRIDRIQIAPDGIGPLLTDLAAAGANLMNTQAAAATEAD